ncbi:MAG TPA: hypothetical protein VL400_17480 [Polyangiaceae bacterium]|jgi:hypothetical protein|nr:hypothetical protein [Polyangiaceae bacterium]
MSPVPRHLRAARHDRVVVFVHDTTSPTDDEWELVLDHFRAMENLAEARALVYTEGAAPTVVQRGKLNDLVGSRNPRIAVLTPSKIARAAGAALRWFNPRLRVFNPTDLDGALGHLEVTQTEATTLRSTLGRLAGELGLATLASLRP